MSRVERVDKVDRATLAVDCTEADFRTFETALHQVLHRTTVNEPLKMVQQVEGQRGFEAWHLIVRRYDQRNTSDRSSAYAALISNITERDRAKDVEQFDDILRTFTNEMTKFENRFGKIRDEEKVLSVKKLMPESLLNYRFRGTAMLYDELIIALENIIIDKVSTVTTWWMTCMSLLVLPALTSISAKRLAAWSMTFIWSSWIFFWMSLSFTSMVTPRPRMFCSMRPIFWVVLADHQVHLVLDAL